jgi:hypothetical protein
MGKEVMRRKASDNPYLHKDFHGALSEGIEYLHERFGEEAVREYLRGFAAAFYSPLTADIKSRGLAALKEYLERIYRAEGARIDLRCTADELVLRVEACPAVTHMREHGYRVARLFHEATRTVNETICEGTPFAAELEEYDPATGRSVQRFFRRSR